MTTATSKTGTELNWILNQFVSETPGAISAQTVSADGIHLAASDGLTDISCDQMAAICSGLASLTDGASDLHQIAPVARVLIEAETGWIVVSRISSRASLAVVARKDSDLGMIGFEMAQLAEATGNILSPDVIAALKNSLAG